VTECGHVACLMANKCFVRVRQYSTHQCSIVSNRARQSLYRTRCNSDVHAERLLFSPCACACPCLVLLCVVNVDLRAIRANRRQNLLTASANEEKRLVPREISMNCDSLDTRLTINQACSSIDRDLKGVRKLPNRLIHLLPRSRLVVVHQILKTFD
jgi:hypothetical protein